MGYDAGGGQGARTDNVSTTATATVTPRATARPPKTACWLTRAISTRKTPKPRPAATARIRLVRSVLCPGEAPATSQIPASASTNPPYWSQEGGPTITLFTSTGTLAVSTAAIGATAA